MQNFVDKNPLHPLHLDQMKVPKLSTIWKTVYRTNFRWKTLQSRPMSSLFERHLVVFSAIVLDGQSYQIGFFVTTGKITQVLAKKGNILNVNSALVTQISELNHQTFQGGSICLATDCTLLKITWWSYAIQTGVSYENGIDSQDYMPCSFAFSHLIAFFLHSRSVM